MLSAEVLGVEVVLARHELGQWALTADELAADLVLEWEHVVALQEERREM